MIHRHKKSVLLFLCLQAMAVAIICLGSLINFHQYKIWGKPLIPNFVGYKRDIEKYSKTLSFSKHSRDSQHLQKKFYGSDFGFPSEVIHIEYGYRYLVSIGLFQPTPESDRVFSCGLRGPPIS